MNQDHRPRHRRPGRVLLPAVLAVAAALSSGLVAAVVMARPGPAAPQPAAQAAGTAAPTVSTEPGVPAMDRRAFALSLSPRPLSPRPSTTAPTTAPPSGSPTGWPGPHNTGVPAGTTLVPSGSIVITQPGTVIDRRDVSGCIEVAASNVTIRRTRVRGSCADGTINTSDHNRFTNILIEDVEVDGLDQSTNFPLIAYSGFTCRRCNLHRGGTGIRMGRSVVVEDSYIHDSHTGEESHNAAIAGHGSNTFTLRRSRLECLDIVHCSSALSLYNDDGEVFDVLVEGNLFSGGGYCVYAGAFGGLGRNVVYRNNAFSPTPFANCGEYGPVTQWEPGRGNEWTGNYWNNAARTPVVP